MACSDLPKLLTTLFTGGSHLWYISPHCFEAVLIKSRSYMAKDGTFFFPVPISLYLSSVSLRSYVFYFSERGKRREKERNVSGREKHQSVAPHTSPNQGPNPQLGIESVTFHCRGWCPTNWATLVRATCPQFLTSWTSTSLEESFSLIFLYCLRCLHLVSFAVAVALLATSAHFSS